MTIVSLHNDISPPVRKKTLPLKQETGPAYIDRVLSPNGDNSFNFLKVNLALRL